MDSEKIEITRKLVKKNIEEIRERLENPIHNYYMEEYEKNKMSTLRVICEVYNISPDEIMEILCKIRDERMCKTLEREFEHIYGEKL